MLTQIQIREHYVENHTFDELKMWGFNLELLKQELGYKDSRYMRDYVNKIDPKRTCSNLNGLQVESRDEEDLRGIYFEMEKAE